nr:MAG TPA: hypothetical protein [Caudoviricetes sp.]
MRARLWSACRMLGTMWIRSRVASWEMCPIGLTT